MKIAKSVRVCLCLIVALISTVAGTFTGGARADAGLAATLSVADLTYTPWRIGGGPAEYRQVITFNNVEPVDWRLDQVRITVPFPMGDAFMRLTASPIDSTLGEGKVNHCYGQSMVCDIGGSGTVTIFYRGSLFPTNYPTAPLTVSASLDKAGVSASGKLTITPKADVAVGTAAGQRAPGEVKFSVESLGPSASGPLTVTITGFARQESITSLSQGCSWSGVTIVCHLAQIVPQHNLNQCAGSGFDIGGHPTCHVIGFMLPPTLPDKRLTATVNAPYNDPNRSNNSHTRGTDPVSQGGSNGGRGPGSGSTGSGSDIATVMTPAPSGEAVPSPTVSAETSTVRSDAAQNPSGERTDARVPTASSTIPPWAWITIAAAVLIAASAVWLVRRRRTTPATTVQDG